MIYKGGRPAGPQGTMEGSGRYNSEAGGGGHSCLDTSWSGFEGTATRKLVESCLRERSGHRRYCNG